MTITDNTRPTRTLSRRAAALCLTIGALVAGGTAAAPSASAAGDTTKPDIYGCFQSTTGVAYTGSPVYLEYYSFTSNTWVASRNADTNSSGCIRFNDIAAGRYYLLVAYKYLTNGWYLYGASGYVKTASGDTLYKVSTSTNPTTVDFD